MTRIHDFFNKIKKNFYEIFRSTINDYQSFKLRKFYAKKFPLTNLSFKREYTNVKISLGKYSFSASPVEIYEPNQSCSYKVTIGKYTHIGKNLLLLTSENHTPNLISNNLNNLFLGNYDSLNNTVELLYKNNYKERYGDIFIGNDVWIGNNVTIKGGVNIGNGAIIGANSFVSRNVLPYSIVGGTPARLIKMRFDKETTNKLEKIAFWEWNENEIIKNIQYFYDPEAFIDKFYKI